MMDIEKIKTTRAIGFAVAAAALYALSSPFSKLLLSEVSPMMLAAFLYLGAGIGIGLVSLILKLLGKAETEQPLTKKELPYTIAMVLLDIAAPILLMFALTMTTAANAALLNNFEIAATAVIALIVFKERISKRLWIAIGFVTAASIMLSFEDISSLEFSGGSLLVIGACVCWGLENNCTRMLSGKNPLEIVIIKGLFSGTGALMLALITGERLPALAQGFMVLLLGFAAYGLSIMLYIYAQRQLGAAKTSAYYAAAPFIGTILALIIFKQLPTHGFIAALAVMAAGAYFASTDNR
ncbi:MAG: DMT family transporter [Candidatus Metalachnospira sp.]|nr:DMT family transporter [Candidatus Metalachnospira sp.]